MGALKLYPRQHAGAQPQLLALPGPEQTRKNRKRDSEPVRNRPESLLDPDLHPMVVKTAKINCLGRFGAKTGPRMESVRLGSLSPPEIYHSAATLQHQALPLRCSTRLCGYAAAPGSAATLQHQALRLRCSTRLCG